jgi:hypothetical protein
MNAPLVRLLTGHVVSPVAAIALAISAAAVSLPLAALVTRWAGRASGLLAGYVALLGWVAFSCCTLPDQMFASGAAIAAILVFALAELSDRAATSPRALASVAFYFSASVAWSLAGPVLILPIAAVCLGTLLGTENSRGIRFFVSRAGLGILIATAATRAIASAAADFQPSFLGLGSTSGHSPSWLAAACLATGAIVTFVSLKSGHGASGLGRLLISWLLSPALLATLGIIPTATALAVTTPAWAAVTGIALTDLRRRFRARRASCRLA